MNKKIFFVLLAALLCFSPAYAAKAKKKVDTAVNTITAKSLAAEPVTMTSSASAEGAAPAAVTAAAEIKLSADGAQMVPASASAPAAAAPVSRILTYDECFNLASQNNKEFRMAKLDKDSAEADLQKAAGSFGPTISVAGGYEPVQKSAYMQIAPGVYYPTGSQTWYSARLSLTQPVFTFGKNIFGFKIAEELYKVAQINFKKAQEKLSLDVITAFYGALITKQLYDTQLESYKSTEEYLKITKTKYDNGQASNFDLLQAKVQFANAQPDLQKAEDAYKLSLQNLKNVISLPMDSLVELKGEPEYKKLDLTYEDIKVKFKEKNDDRTMIDSAANIAKYSKNLSIAMLLPNLAINANYTYFNPDEVFHREKSYWASSWDVTLGFQWTLFDSFKTEAGIKSALANEAKANINKENTENMLSIQLDSLFMTMDESRKVIEAADEIIKQAQEGFRIAKESYRNGLIQSIDLMNAEINLMRAKTNYLNALNNYIASMQKLKNFLE